jgi:hypothetical protein
MMRLIIVSQWRYTIRVLDGDVRSVVAKTLKLAPLNTLAEIGTCSPFNTLAEIGTCSPLNTLAEVGTDSILGQLNQQKMTRLHLP